MNRSEFENFVEFAASAANPAAEERVIIMRVAIWFFSDNGILFGWVPRNQRDHISWLKGHGYEKEAKEVFTHIRGAWEHEESGDFILFYVGPDYRVTDEVISAVKAALPDLQKEFHFPESAIVALCGEKSPTVAEFLKAA